MDKNNSLLIDGDLGLLGIKKISDLSSKELEKMIAQGYDVNEADINNDTPLIIACEYNISLIPVLLSAGADFNAQNIEGDTPLISLIKRWDKEDISLKMLDLLLYSGANPCIKNKKSEFPLILSIPSAFEAIEIFIKHKDKINFNMRNELGETFLMKLAEYDDPLEDKMVKYVLDNTDVDISLVDNKGENVLFYLFESNSNSQDNFKILLDKGADINQVNKQKTSPLMAFIYQSCQEFNKRKDGLLDVLLEYNPDLDKQDKNGTTALIVACEFKSNFIPNLIKKGADINITDNNGKNALHIACSSDNLKSLENILDYSEYGVKSLQALDDEGNNILMNAALGGVGVDFVVKLLSYEWDLSQENNNNQNVFDIARAQKNFKFLNVIKEKQAKEEMKGLTQVLNNNNTRSSNKKKL